MYNYLVVGGEPWIIFKSDNHRGHVEKHLVLPYNCFHSHTSLIYDPFLNG